MFRRFLLLLLFAAALTVAGAEKESPIFRSEMKRVLKSAKPFINPSFDSCRIWFASPKVDNIKIQYRPLSSQEKWQDAKISRFTDGDISGYKAEITGLPKPNSYVSYEMQICDGNKILASSKFVKIEKGRLKLAKPVAMGKLMLRPTFNSCSVYFGTPRLADITLEFKKSAQKKWQKALAPDYFFEQSEGMTMAEYRGSIVKLDENTMYDIRLSSGKKVVASGSFKTWASDVPVARTIVLKPSDFEKMPYVISEKGSSDGWIRYTAEKGTVFKSSRSVPMLSVKNASYILLDDMVFSGGPSKNILTIENSKAIRVRNCEMSNWGIIGKPRYDQFGRYFTPHMNRNQYGINWNGAIAIHAGSSEVVVERCFIHSPRNRANSWFYSHPAGPQAIMLHKPDHSTVIRYNDFVGSDAHRFNDAVESVGNFTADGGINRDSDVYGNYMIYCNDDNIELDGGHQNVRCFWNHFEAALCGVSIQGLMVSPVYVFDNLFAGMCEQFGIVGQTIKTTAVLTGDNATAYIFNNTLVRGGTGINIGERMNDIMYNNVFNCDRARIITRENSPSPGSVFIANSVGSARQQKIKGVDNIVTKYVDHDKGNYLPVNPGKAVSIPNFLPNGGIRGAFQLENTMILPYRPIPVSLDRTRIGEVEVKNGTASPAVVKITATVGGKDFKANYSIRKNPEFDWFEVTPSKGLIKSGDKITLIVKFVPGKMNKNHNYRGAFLFRLDNGFSRPVTVTAKTDVVEPFKREQAGDFALYIDAFKPAKVYDAKRGKVRKIKIVDDPMAVNGKSVSLHRRTIYEYHVNVPEDGRYYFMLHGRKLEAPEILAGVNKDKMEKSKQQFSTDFTSWTMITPGRKFGNMCRHYDLKKGVNVLKLQGSSGKILYDGIVLTDNPEPFEPRP